MVDMLEILCPFRYFFVVKIQVFVSRQFLGALKQLFGVEVEVRETGT
jgi:hypothetical protein